MMSGVLKLIFNLIMMKYVKKIFKKAVEEYFIYKALLPIFS